MQIEENISLLPYNTFRLNAAARYFSRISQPGDLENVLDFTLNNGLENRMILGGGSNILLTGNFNGIVIRNEIMGLEIVKEDDDFVYLKAGAGENWHSFVMHCVENNLAGVENLSLIPGNVGASPMQNIGAYGVEIKDVFHELQAFHLDDREYRTFNLQECEFGYRESVFKRKYRNRFMITHVTYRLSKIPSFNTSYGAISQELENMGVKELTIRALSQAVINIRSSKLPDPKEIGNAGSFFKNPQVSMEKFEELQKEFPGIVGFPVGANHKKLAAGWLIEQCGWKGYRNGDAGCYPKQALVLVNYGHATGDEIFGLSEKIIQSVEEKFGVLLEREVNVV
ncbi:MAG TPA: UDP-N-acetylmuramate dehydrogenase [Flavisolibacter sp.]